MAVSLLSRRFGSPSRPPVRPSRLPGIGTAPASWQDRLRALQGTRNPPAARTSLMAAPTAMASPYSAFTDLPGLPNIPPGTGPGSTPSGTGQRVHGGYAPGAGGGGTHRGGGNLMPTADQALFYWEDLNRYADAMGQTNNWVDTNKDALVKAFQLNPNWYEAPGVYDTFLDVPHASELYETMQSYFGGGANYGWTDEGRQYTNYIPGWDAVGSGRRA